MRIIMTTQMQVCLITPFEIKGGIAHLLKESTIVRTNALSGDLSACNITFLEIFPIRVGPIQIYCFLA